MKYLKTFEHHLKTIHFSDGYYINSCSTCNQIMTVKPSPGHNWNEINYEETMKKNLKYLIEHIKRSPEKAITFGNKTNATSIKISKEHFDILVSEFPEKSNIK